MIKTPLKDIVLVGAGYAHALALRAFARKPPQGARLTLVTRQAYTPYSGMLPGLIAGLYAFEDIHIGLRRLCSDAGARLILDEATGADLSARRLIRAGGPPIPFDILSFDTGSAPEMRGVPGAAEHAVAIKPISGLLAQFELAKRRVLANGGRASISVAGGGAAGTELMLSIERRLRRDASAAGYGADRLSFTLLSADPDILKAFPRRLRTRFREILSSRGIRVIAGKPVISVEDGVVHLEGGEMLPSDWILWSTEASAAPWLAQTGLERDAKGFIKVEATLESISHPGIFAAGDVASLRGRLLPKAGVYAVREGPVLAENLRAAAAGKPLKPFKPQRHILSLITTGERYAIGTRNGVTFEGAWVWRWKDWIDRRFMRGFNKLPAGALSQ